MSKKKTTEKAREIKLRDLVPKKDAVGGQASYLRTAALSIPPPGFIASSGNGQTDKHR